MLALSRAGHLELPPLKMRPPNPLARRARPDPVEVERAPLCARLDELVPLTFRQVFLTLHHAFVKFLAGFCHQFPV